MPAKPYGTVAFDVDEIPRGERQRVGIADDLTRPRADQAAIVAAQTDARHLVQPPLAPAAEHIEHVRERHLAFAGHDDVAPRSRYRSG